MWLLLFAVQPASVIGDVEFTDDKTVRETVVDVHPFYKMERWDSCILRDIREAVTEIQEKHRFLQQQQQEENEDAPEPQIQSKVTFDKMPTSFSEQSVALKNKRRSHRFSFRRYDNA